MCGIAGCYQQADGRKLTDIMTVRIAHRGPDAYEVWNHGDDRVSVQLGHWRLSIIDLSAAAGRPLSKDGLIIVYNGELYNYKEVRAELASRGVSFVTSSDTEVVLKAWRYWAPASLPRFRGMFASALADGRSGELFLARDPLGIRASALEHLIADERAGRQDNAKQIWQLLTMELRYRNARSMGVTA